MQDSARVRNALHLDPFVFTEPSPEHRVELHHFSNGLRDLARTYATPKSKAEALVIVALGYPTLIRLQLGKEPSLDRRQRERLVKVFCSRQCKCVPSDQGVGQIRRDWFCNSKTAEIMMFATRLRNKAYRRDRVAAVADE